MLYEVVCGSVYSFQDCETNLRAIMLALQEPVDTLSSTITVINHSLNEEEYFDTGKFIQFMELGNNYEDVVTEIVA